jgi:general secretion pathway protein G
MINRRQKMKLIHVIIIICLIISVIVIGKKWRESNDIGCRVDLRRAKIVVIKAAIKTYRQHTGKFPNKLEDLINCPIGLENAWQGPYLKEKQMYDPWNRPYIYILDSNDFSLKSYGADGKPGGEGYDKDISNE